MGFLELIVHFLCKSIKANRLETTRFLWEIDDLRFPKRMNNGLKFFVIQDRHADLVSNEKRFDALKIIAKVLLHKL